MKIYLKRDGKTHKWLVTIEGTSIAFNTSIFAFMYIEKVKAVN